MNRALNLFKFIFLFTILTGIQNVQATPACIDKDKAAAIHRDFQFLGDTSYDPRKCNADSLTEKLLSVIQFIKDMKVAPPSNGPLDLNVIKGPFYTYFKERVKTIVFVKENDGQCNGILAYIYPSENRGRVYICNSIFFNTSKLGQISTLIHEARHFDGFDHVSCVRGFRKGIDKPFCDKNYTDGGSYAIEVSLYLQISKDAALSPALRRAAKMSAGSSLVSRFNTLPADLKDGAFVTNTNKLVSFFDGKNQQAALQLKPNQSLIYFTSYNPALRNKGSNQFTDFTYGLALDSTSESPIEVKNLLGLATNEDCFLILYPTSLKVISKTTGQQVNVRFSQINPLAIFELSWGSRYKVYLTDQHGYIVELPQKFKEYEGLRESQLKMQKNNDGILRMQTWQGDREDIAVTIDGRLIIYNRKNEKWRQALPGTDFIDVIAPVVWSKSLQNL